MKGIDNIKGKQGEYLTRLHFIYSDYHNSANFFLHTTLVNSNDNSDIHHVNGNKTTAGSVVQSLHKLKDTNNTGKYNTIQYNTI